MNTEDRALLYSLVYVGCGMFRDSRVPRGETAVCLHGQKVIDLAKKCVEAAKEPSLQN